MLCFEIQVVSVEGNEPKRQCAIAVVPYSRVDLYFDEKFMELLDYVGSTIMCTIFGNVLVQL